MSHSADISDLATLVKNGKLTEAKRAARTLLDNADPHDLEVIANCAHTLETWPKIGVAKLRHYWQEANAHDRAIIAACVPEPGEQRHRPHLDDGRQPRWTRKTRYQAPRDNAARQDPAIVTAYQRERAGIDDAPEQTERPAGYALDYDRAALADIQATPCVRCWLERSTTDYAGQQDDGLCGDCRDKGRPGIPALPEGHTRADAINARCAFIATHFPTAAIKLLRRYWQRCTDPADRATIANWVQQYHPNCAAETVPPTAPEVTACSTCGQERSLRDLRGKAADDGLCTACRRLDSDATPPPADATSDQGPATA